MIQRPLKKKIMVAAIKSLARLHMRWFSNNQDKDVRAFNRTAQQTQNQDPHRPLPKEVWTSGHG